MQPETIDQATGLHQAGRPLLYAEQREFRQAAPRDWATPIAAAADALAALARA